MAERYDLIISVLEHKDNNKYVIITLLPNSNIENRIFIDMVVKDPENTSFEQITKLFSILARILKLSIVETKRYNNNGELTSKEWFAYGEIECD